MNKLVKITALTMCLVIVTAFAINTYAAENNNDQLTGQLNIFRAALYMPAAEENVRIDAAIELLKSLDPDARTILIAALEQSDNPQARQAVCKALSISRGWKEAIKNNTDFLEPLINILKTQASADAALAAEAALIYEYPKIAKSITSIIEDERSTPQAKTNAIYALGLRPNKEAIFELIKITESDNTDIAAVAAKALQDSLGIPIGADKAVWQQIQKELSRKSRDEFVRDRLIRQEAKVRVLEKELDIWKQKYQAALDKIYLPLNSDDTKAQFLAEQLQSPYSELRLWALEKVSQWRKGGYQLPKDIGPLVLKLVSDENPAVRLKTAQVLNLMSDLDSTEILLTQISNETDRQVRIELLGALGQACYYALSPGSAVKITEHTRIQTLNIAAEFIADSDPAKASKGAGVAKKLLEQEGLQISDVENILAMLVKKYREQNEEDQKLRGELVNAMAGLCGKGYFYRKNAAKIFEPIFTESLSDEDPLVRESSVVGLINIDPIKALDILVKNELFDDAGITIRENVISLAADFGKEADIEWLEKKLAVNSEGELAWQAIVKILDRNGIELLDKWIKSSVKSEVWQKLNAEQKKILLESAYQKSQASNNSIIKKDLALMLAEFYKKDSKFADSAKYYGIVVGLCDDPGQKDKYTAELFEVHLSAGQFDPAVNILANVLLNKDLTTESKLVTMIENYRITNPDKWPELFSKIKSVKFEITRLGWQNLLNKWGNAISVNL